MAMLASTTSAAPRTAAPSVLARHRLRVVPVRAGGKKKGKGGGGGDASSSSPERVDRLLSRLGYCARGEAKRWVGAGRVTLDGEPVRRADAKVLASSPSLMIDGEAPEFIYGITASFYDLLPERWRSRNPGVETVGRLDKDTTGLLLLTDDGALLHRLTSPKKKVAKVYEVIVDADLPLDAPALFASGTLTLTGESKPCRPATLALDTNDKRRGSLTLVEGKYHQVKRMCNAVGCEVIALHRSSFGRMTLDGLAEGEVRVLTREELERWIGPGEDAEDAEDEEVGDGLEER
jgi:16S rRNA pseudouridine516 synthase